MTTESYCRKLTTIGNQKLYQLLAWYHSNKFVLGLPTGSLDLEGFLLARNVDLFIHEYLHYFQNLYTLTGLSSLAIQCRILGEMMTYLYRTNRIRIPLLESDPNCEEVGRIYENLDFSYALSFPLSDDSMNTKENLKLAVINQQYVKLTHYDVKIVWQFPMLIFSKEGLPKVPLQGFVLAESFSYIAERVLHQKGYLRNLKRAPQYPYHIFDLVCELEYPDCPDLLRLAIILLSLDTPQPGANSLNLLRVAYNQELGNKTSLNLWEEHLYPQIKNEIDRFEEAILPDLQNFADYISKEERGILKESTRELAERIKKINEEKRKDRLSPLRLFLGKDFGNELASFVLKYRPPFMAVGQKLLSLREMDLSYYRGLMLLKTSFDLIDLFVFGGDSSNTHHLKCPNFAYCKNALKSLSPDTCLLRPWERMTLEKTCPIGATCSYLGLSTVKIYS